MNTNTAEIVDPQGRKTTSTINNTMNSSLTITDAVKFYTGYYWVGTPSVNVCNVSLTVFGTSMCIDRILYYYT